MTHGKLVLFSCREITGIMMTSPLPTPCLFLAQHSQRRSLNKLKPNSGKVEYYALQWGRVYTARVGHSRGEKKHFNLPLQLLLSYPIPDYEPCIGLDNVKILRLVQTGLIMAGFCLASVYSSPSDRILSHNRLLLNEHVGEPAPDQHSLIIV